MSAEPGAIAELAGALPPGLLLIVGAFAVPLLRGPPRAAYALALPLLGLAQVLALPSGNLLSFEMFGLAIEPMRIDPLARAFGIIFHIAAALGVIYAWHRRNGLEDTMALIYAGAAVGAVFAGDLITLFVYWELTAIASVFLILSGDSQRARRAALRYLVVQVGSGVILLSGLILRAHNGDGIAFDRIGIDDWAGRLIFLAFGIKCAFPFLHNWLQDAYPEASVAGTVFLSAFTTKMAVYALARGFAGTEILIPIGAAMTAFPIFYAVIENDLRRVLAYSLNNQLGFMVVGIGIGTEMALNGTVAHAFCHILYKALLFMAMGAVLFRVGTIKGSELGGLYKSMPLTAVFCIIGAASISAFPLFSGFISKSLVIGAAANEGYFVTWLVLLFASAGVFHHSGIKIPYFAFFAHDSGKRCAEAPWPMLIAMGIAAAFCVGIGVWPDPLYGILPFAVDFVPYTASHVITQLQLLMFSALAFAVLMRTGLYPPELKSTNLDSDWLYRRVLARALAGTVAVLAPAWALARAWSRLKVDEIIAAAFRHHGPEGILARTWPTGSMVLWAAVMLALFAFLSYL